MAQKDIKGAKILFKHDADHEIVCFHCQQAIEKYLKGFLIYKTGFLHEGHNLVKLCKKAMIYEETLSSFLKDMSFVNTFYIETRYHSVDPLIVSTEDTEECLSIVERFIAKINELMRATMDDSTLS